MYPKVRNTFFHTKMLDPVLYGRNHGAFVKYIGILCVRNTMYEIHILLNATAPSLQSCQRD